MINSMIKNESYIIQRGGGQWNVPHPNICPSMNRYVNVYILLLSPGPNVYSHHFDNGTSAAALHY